ncbi:uncharacterized protein LOC142792466 [Rhipicephalus microplus]|uniref:uncharacterized protein LOC142792466 n=1 Tax=Rhipicephalus microplus TaxID=6941 RepID=UPI003F6D4B63
MIKHRKMLYVPGQWSKKPEEQVRVTTSNTSPPDISSTPATKRGDGGEEAAKAVQPEDSALSYAEKAERIEPCEASKEAEGSPRDDERTGACRDADSGSSGDQPNLSESKYAAALEDAEDRPPGEDVPQDSVIAEEEPHDGSAESTLEDFQSLEDILDGGTSRRKEEDGRLSAFLSNALRALYSFFWYDFCEASAITPEPPTSSQQEVLAQASPAAGAKGQGKVTPKTKEPPCKGSRLSDWRAWREAGPKKPPAVIARLACLLRSAGYRIYPARPPAQFWPQGDVCTALCHSCECDYDENSTCGVARRAWKARTSPAVHALYTGLLHSRALCASAVLLGALRQNYVYRVVLCAPLVILLTMVTRCLYILMQLRRYLENSNTPAVNTRDCSNRHSEDEDLSPLERHRRQDHPLEDEHPDKHADVAIGKLNRTIASLRGYCTFIEKSTSCYNTKPQPQMAATTLRGYDPTTLAWKEISTPASENSVPPTDIVDEGLFTVAALRKRRQQSKATKASATNKAASANIPPEKKTLRVPWRPTAMPRIAAEYFTIVLKPRRFHQKAWQDFGGPYTFEGHRVPRFVHYKSVVTPVRKYKRPIPACYRCGTVGHRVELCPHLNDQCCGHCGQVVGASEEEMALYECKPSCLVCGEGHLTVSQACKARFHRLH